MTANTKIEWATHSFSPFIGCSRVHTGCTNCYAAAMAGRLGVVWGPDGTRRRTAESAWKQVERWNRQAACRCDELATDTMTVQSELHLRGCPQADRPRVFPSLCDPFEDWPGVVLGPVGHGWRLADVRRDFFALIDRCPNLDFLLLTKRPANVRRMWRYVDGAEMSGDLEWRHNAWLLYSASDQATFESGLPHLLACRDLVPVLGLSLEPLIGPVDLYRAVWGLQILPRQESISRVDWVIVGGESGPRHRPMEIAWLESVADQCSDTGVPLFVKQDCGPKAGQQGRIPDALWTRKEFPKP